MEIVYSKLKSGKNAVDDVCDNLAAAFSGNGEFSKAKEAADKCQDHDYYISELNSVKTSLTNMISEIQDDICKPISNILGMMEDDISDHLEDKNSSYFNFDYKNNLIINLSNLYGDLKESGKSDNYILNSIKNQYGFNDKECNDIKANYEYCKLFEKFDNYLNKNLPSIDVAKTEVVRKYLLDNYRGDLIGGIKSSNYYKEKGLGEKGLGKDFTVNKELLNKKVIALKEAYNLSDDDANKLFAIVTREDVSLNTGYSSGEIYYEAANVMSSALNRANRTKKYFTSGGAGEPIKQLFDPSQYDGALYSKYKQFLNSPPDEVVDAVCDVLLSGVPSHDYDSFYGSGYVNGRRGKESFVPNGNNYYNM